MKNGDAQDPASGTTAAERMPRHAPQTWYPLRDGELTAGGIPLGELAERVGQTPFYVYDRKVMAAKVALLRETLPARLKLHYAIKANPMPAVVGCMARLVDGLDVASLGELQVALDSGMPPAAISFAGPGKSTRELAAAVAAGITVNVESEGELARLAAQGAAQGIRPRIAVRVNPDFELKSSGMKMAGGPKAFGVDAERVPALLREVGHLDLAFQGLHIFCGSQNLKAEAIVEAQAATFELAYRLAEDAPGPLLELNIGGGFGIPYFPGELPLDLAPIAAHLAQRMSEAARRLPQAEIVLELGRYLVGEAGLYVCRIVDCKRSRGRLFAITDGGLHHHLAASGNFGQVIRKNYPLAVARPRSGPLEAVDVVGPLCTPLDILGSQVALPPLAEGDLIAVFQSGAYGRTASPAAFLGHPPAAEILV